MVPPQVVDRFQTLVRLSQDAYIDPANLKLVRALRHAQNFRQCFDSALRPNIVRIPKPHCIYHCMDTHSSGVQRREILSERYWNAFESPSQIGELGEGAFAKVTHCELKLGDKTVDCAVKTLRPELISNRDDLKMFIREGVTLKRIHHPCVLRPEPWTDNAISHARWRCTGEGRVGKMWTD